MNNKPIEQPAVASALDRIGARRILQRIGVVHESSSGLPSDTPEVRQLLADDPMIARPIGGLSSTR